MGSCGRLLTVGCLVSLNVGQQPSERYESDLEVIFGLLPAIGMAVRGHATLGDGVVRSDVLWLLVIYSHLVIPWIEFGLRCGQSVCGQVVCVPSITGGSGLVGVEGGIEGSGGLLSSVQGGVLLLTGMEW
jgi:hypothetical protein